MDETPFYFSNNTCQLFGVYHEPENTPTNQGFVFVHPFAEEKLWTHLVMVNFARELARRGIPVLRFDFMGHGDSEGDFEDASIETRLLDINCALRIFAEKAPAVQEIGLLGLRFGATLAALAAEQVDGIKKLILWEPILDGERYMQEILRSNLATQNAVYKEIRHTREDLVRMMQQGESINIDGYSLSYDMYQQACAINLATNEKIFSGSTFIVQINRKRPKPNKKLEKLQSTYKTADLAVSIEEPFWKEIKLFYAHAENLFQTTFKWLE